MIFYSFQMSTARELRLQKRLVSENTKIAALKSKITKQKEADTEAAKILSKQTENQESTDQEEGENETVKTAEPRLEHKKAESEKDTQSDDSEREPENTSELVLVESDETEKQSENTKSKRTEKRPASKNIRKKTKTVLVSKSSKHKKNAISDSETESDASEVMKKQRRKKDTHLIDIPDSEWSDSTANDDTDDDENEKDVSNKYPAVNYDFMLADAEYHYLPYARRWKYDHNRNSETNIKFVINYALADSDQDRDWNIDGVLTPHLGCNVFEKSKLWKEMAVNRPFWFQTNEEKKKHIDMALVWQDATPTKKSSFKLNLATNHKKYAKIEVFKRKKIFPKTKITDPDNDNTNHLVKVMTIDKPGDQQLDILKVMQPNRDESFDVLVFYIDFNGLSGKSAIVCLQCFFGLLRFDFLIF